MERCYLRLGMEEMSSRYGKWLRTRTVSSSTHPTAQELGRTRRQK